MPTYRVTFRNGSTETVNAGSAAHARDIVTAKLRRDLKRGFPDIAPASKDRLMRDANREGRAASVSEVNPGTPRTVEGRGQ